MSATKRLPRISGDATTAESWITTSALPGEQKSALLNFVKRFPTLRFYKQERPATEPGWLRDLGSTLVSVAPGDLCWFRLKNFDRPIPRAAELRRAWYHRLPFVADVTSEYDQIFMDDEPLLFVAGLIEDLTSLLVVKSGPNADQGVYEFNYKHVKSIGNRQGQIASGDAQLVFDSYANMLNQVVAIKLEGDEVVNSVPE